MTFPQNLFAKKIQKTTRFCAPIRSDFFSINFRYAMAVSLLEINQLFSKTIGAEATTLLASANPHIRSQSICQWCARPMQIWNRKNNGEIEREKHTHSHCCRTYTCSIK